MFGKDSGSPGNNSKKNGHGFNLSKEKKDTDLEYFLDMTFQKKITTTYQHLLGDSKLNKVVVFYMLTYKENHKTHTYIHNW